MRLLTLFPMLFLAAGVCLSQSRSFSGEIMDGPCAAMGSHDRMMKGVDAKNAKDCSEKCARLKFDYVLYDPGTKTVYQVDDQAKLASYAGRKVSVKGVYDSASKTIHVENIEVR